MSWISTKGIDEHFLEQEIKVQTTPWRVFLCFIIQKLYKGRLLATFPFSYLGQTFFYLPARECTNLLPARTWLCVLLPGAIFEIPLEERRCL